MPAPKGYEGYYVTRNGQIAGDSLTGDVYEQKNGSWGKKPSTAAQRAFTKRSWADFVKSQSGGAEPVVIIGGNNLLIQKG